MRKRNIDKMAENGRAIVHRLDDLAISESIELLKRAADPNTDSIINTIATAFYMGYAAGYKRGRRTL